jgi:hypothetical protein
LALEDIADPGFDPAQHGLSRRNRVHSQFACRRSRPDRDRSA